MDRRSHSRRSCCTGLKLCKFKSNGCACCDVSKGVSRARQEMGASNYSHRSKSIKLKRQETQTCPKFPLHTPLQHRLKGLVSVQDREGQGREGSKSKNINECSTQKMERPKTRLYFIQTSFKYEHEMIVAAANALHCTTLTRRWCVIGPSAV